MEKTDLVLFDKDKINDVLTQFDFKTKIIGTEEIVLGDKGEPALCHTCENEIIVKKVGTIAHGSRLIFCDNPLCFASWVAEKKII